MASKSRSRSSDKNNKRAKNVGKQDNVGGQGDIANQIDVMLNGTGRFEEQNSPSSHMWMQAPDETPDEPPDEDQTVITDKLMLKKISHNEKEKLRKGRINMAISRLGDLLPDIHKESSKHHKLSNAEVFEKAVIYIQDLKEKTDAFLLEKGQHIQALEIQNLRTELEKVKSERDKYLEIIKNHGKSAVTDMSGQWAGRMKKDDLTPPDLSYDFSGNSVSSSVDAANSKEQEPAQKSKSKSRKKTLSNQIRMQQQAAAEQQVLLQQGMMPMQGMPGTFVPGHGSGQNIMMNSPIMPSNVPMCMPGAAGMMGMGLMQQPASLTNATAGSTGTVTSTTVIGSNVAAHKNTLDGIGGLLQIAMQDAGIMSHPSSGSQANQTEESADSNMPDATSPIKSVNTSAAVSSEDSPSDDNSAAQQTALHTLASIATKSTSVEVKENTVVTTTVHSSQAVAPTQTSAPTLSVPQSVPQSSQLLMSNMQGSQAGVMSANQINSSANAMMNMPFMNNGQNMPFGMMPNNVIQTPQGQLLLVNEQGIPMMGNMPIGNEMLNNLNMGVTSAVQNMPLINQTEGAGKSTAPVNKASEQQSNAPLGNEQMQSSVINTGSSSDPNILQRGSTASVQSNVVAAGGGNVLPASMNMALQAAGNVAPNPMMNQAVTNQVVNGQQFVQSVPQMQAMTGGQLINQGQGMFLPNNQNGGFMTTMNQLPQQQNNLPTALMLPNGQLIPVVSNPQLFPPQNVPFNPTNQLMQQNLPGGNMIVSNNMMLNGMPGNVLVGPDGRIMQNIGSGQLTMNGFAIPNNQQNLQQPGGLLMTASTAVQSTVVSNTMASLNTNVIATSSNQNLVMTTHVQSSNVSISANTPATLKSSTDTTNTSGSVMMSQSREFSNALSQNSLTEAQNNLNKSNNVPNAGAISVQPNMMPQLQPGTVLPQPQQLPPQQLPPQQLQGVLPGTSVNQGNVVVPAGTVLPMNQSVPSMGPNGSILLSLPMNGHQTTVLVDPTTMQVLGSVPPQTQPPQIASQTSNSVTNTIASKPFKKNQRAICPKPNSSRSQTTTCSSPLATDTISASTVSSTSLVSSTKHQASTGTTSSQPQTPVEPDTNTQDITAEASPAQPESSKKNVADTQESTPDILAKAAESIFSSLSPTLGGFYNPANEDNPLQIDTSAGDTEDDLSSVSPTKGIHDSSKLSVIEEKSEGQVIQQVPDSSTDIHVEPTPALPPESTPDPPLDELIEPKMMELAVPQESSSAKSKKSKQKSKQTKTAVINPLVSESPKQNKKSTKKSKKEKKEELCDMPETLTFSANDLSDVLDQVENLSNVLSSTPNSKKSKGKKNKQETSAHSEQPLNKKRKQNTREKSSIADNGHSDNLSKLSIYDFNDDSANEFSPEPLLRKSDSSTSLSLASSSGLSSKPISTCPSTTEDVKTAPEDMIQDKDLSPNNANDVLDAMFSENLKSDSDNNVKTSNDSDMKTDSERDLIEASTNYLMETPKCSERLKTVTTPDNDVLSMDVCQIAQDSISDSSGESSFFSSSVPLLQMDLDEAPKSNVSEKENMEEPERVAMRPMSADAMRPLSADNNKTMQNSPIPAPIVENIDKTDDKINTQSLFESVSLPSSNDNNPQMTSPEVPYSCTEESLFSSPARSNKETSPSIGEVSEDIESISRNSSSERTKGGIYSAENFVQTSVNESEVSRSTPIVSTTPQPTKSVTNVISQSTPEDAFSLSYNNNTAKSLPPSCNVSENLVQTSSTSSFTFSLSQTTSSPVTVSASMSQPGHGQYPPFYPPHNVPSSQSPTNQSMVNRRSQNPMHIPPFGLDLSQSVEQPKNKPNVQGSQNTQEQAPQMTENAPNPYNFAMADSCAMRGPKLFHTTPPSSMDKTVSDSSRNPKHNVDNMNSRNVQNSNPDRGATMHSMDAAPARNTASLSPCFSSPSYQNSSQSLHTPPLHHQSMSVDVNRMQNHRMPFDSSASFSNPNNNFSGVQSYGNSRMDPHSMHYPSSGPGSQPLSHPPNPHQHSETSKPPNHHSAASKTTKHPPKPQQMPQVQNPNHRGAMQMPAPQATPPQGHGGHQSASPLHQHPPSQQQSQQHPRQPQQNSQPHSQTQLQASSRQSNTKQSRTKQSKKKTQGYPEMEQNLSHSFFDANRSITPYFPLQNLPSPNSRNMQSEAPSFLPGNIFSGPPRPLGNSGSAMSKNPDLASPFNPLFQPPRQNGLGLNFQPGFGVNSVHGNPNNGPQITPHSSSMPHMPNFNLSNIFSDVNSASQNDSLNISPIKFPHTNTILPPQSGMEPNALQHSHQSGSLYPNRTPHPSMIHNSISFLGHNHPGFEGRQMPQGISSSVGAPFHGHGHPSFMPPLNFSMHDH